METKTDNAHAEAKLNLRRHFLKKFGGPFHVLDCCQGSGAMWSALRKEFEVASYWGVDLKHKKGRMKIDSIAICSQPDLRQNVIDVDTYCSPWKHWEAIVANLSQPTTVFLTWGQVRQSGDSVIAKAIGLDRLPMKPPQTCFSFLTKWALPFVLGLALDKCRVIECTEVLTTSSTARYFGVRLEPLAGEQPTA
jgi:hypothetical protein